MDLNCAIRAYEAAFENFPKAGTESGEFLVLTIFGFLTSMCFMIVV